jgi:biopolymer transport protein ExbD
MAEVLQEKPPREEEPESPVVLRKPEREDVDMDITPMIDIVFLLLIFFLVCSTAASQMAVELPTARHGTGVSERNSVTITVEAAGGDEPATIYIGDTSGKPLPNSVEQQEAEIVQAVEEGVAQGKTNVLVMAAKDAKHKDVSRAAAAVGQVEGVKLYMAVVEKN